MATVEHTPGAKHDVQYLEAQEVEHNSGGGQFGHISGKLIWLTVWSFMAVFAFGICGVCIGGVVVQENFAVKFNEAVNIKYITGIISVYHGGGFFAVVSSSYVSEKWGRKASFLYNAIFYVIGNALCIGCVNIGMLLAGRLLAGWGSYGFLYSSQIYVMEQAPARARGLLATAANGLAMEVGYILGGWLSVAYNDWAMGSGSSWSWRMPFLVNMIPVIILLAGYPFVPESSRWLVSQGRAEEALDVLKTLHGTAKDVDHTFAIAEHNHIVHQYELDRTLPSTWLSMFTTYRKRTFTAILVQWGFLLGGAYFLATYGPQLFGAFGFTTRKSLIYQAATLTFLIINWGSGPLIDRVGRKPFLVTGLAGELVMLCILCALSKYYGDGQSKAGANAFVAIYLFNEVVVAITEPAAYLMAAELFPLHVRTKGVSISFGFLALTNMWILESAGTMVHNLHWKAYLLFICITASNVFLFIWLLPETKNVPLEDMAKLFGDKDQVADYDTYTNGDKTPEKVQ